MDHEFALTRNILLTKLRNLVAIAVIDDCPIESSDIAKDSEPIRVVLGDLVSIISFNIIHSLEHPLILGLPWFELHNPKIDWMKRTIEESQEKRTTLASLTSPTFDIGCDKVSNISLRRLREEDGNEDVFVFAIIATPSPIFHESGIQLPEKYNTLLEHHPYVCTINLQPCKEPPWGPIYTLSPVNLET